jgi:peptidoglycan biosynthesis protein MviN/MurJ (putative lipid II flippase)
LSASFIPVYASLVARGERRDADRVAGAVASLLALAVAALVLAGVFATPILITVIAPGFTGDKRALTIEIVRVLFPGAGLLVLSAWCLGVLNSHHRFLLSYAAPVMWNAAMIVTLVVFGGQTTLPRLAVLLAWGSVAGSALQFAVQVPVVLRVAPDLRFGLGILWRGAFSPADAALKGPRHTSHVHIVTRNFVPGVHQPGRRPGERLHRRAAGKPAADRCGHRAVQRAAALHAAGEPVRHVDRGGGAAGDVG